MKISAINLNIYRSINNKNNSTKKVFEQNNQNQNYFTPTTAQYLAFTGGDSLNLTATYLNLKDEQYPNQDIKKAIKETLKTGNVEDKTLYDVHFEKYKGVLDCFSLDELKEKYPEFQSVISAYDVMATPDSFVGKFQEDELELFPFDEDLTLQLIKLYWGQGFSLNDLAKHTAQESEDGKGINLYYAMNNKLNIPLMNQRYANILKLSNKEYNEKFTAELAIKLIEAKEARQQRAEGEAVIIPRGPLSELHKKHISESLKKHYKENPEALYALSQRQKKFYEDHPEEAQEMSEVMLYAWNLTQEGKSLAKHISKFMKKMNIPALTNEELADFNKLDKAKNAALKAFWERNGWAKKQLSIAMQKAYKLREENKEKLQEQAHLIERIKLLGKTIPGVQLTYNITPTELQNNIESWAKSRGIDTKYMFFGKATLYKDKEDDFATTKIAIDYKNNVNKIMDEYYDLHPEEPDAVATSLQYALAQLIRDLENKNLKALPPSLRKNDGKINVLIYAFRGTALSGNPTFAQRGNKLVPLVGVDVTDIHYLYNSVLNQAMMCGCEDLALYMDKKLDEGYKKYKDTFI